MAVTTMRSRLATMVTIPSARWQCCPRRSRAGGKRPPPAPERSWVVSPQLFQSSLADQHARRPQLVAQLGEDLLAGVQGLPGASRSPWSRSRRPISRKARASAGRSPMARNASRAASRCCLASAHCRLSRHSPAMLMRVRAVQRRSARSSKDGERGSQVGAGIIEAPRQPVRVAAVAKDHRLAAVVLQLPENGQALRQCGDRRGGIAVVAVHDRELPHGAGLPAAVAEVADDVQALGYQRECLLARYWSRKTSE